MGATGEVALVGPSHPAASARSSFEQVYRGESRAVVGLAALLVGSQAVAEELAQDAFLRLFERFDEVDNPAAFLRTVVVRLCLTTLRRRRGEQQRLARIGVDPPCGIPEVDIADSMVVATETDLGALRDQAGANIAALPVAATAETGIGTVEVHGDMSSPRLCLLRPGAAGPDCATALLGSYGADGMATATADWTIDGTWYVVVASQGHEPQIVGGRDQRSAPAAGELPSEAVVAGEWTIRLVRPAPDIVSVCTRVSGGVSCNQHRGD